MFCAINGLVLVILLTKVSHRKCDSLLQTGAPSANCHFWLQCHILIWAGNFSLQKANDECFVFCIVKVKRLLRLLIFVCSMWKIYIAGWKVMPFSSNFPLSCKTLLTQDISLLLNMEDSDLISTLMHFNKKYTLLHCDCADMQGWCVKVYLHSSKANCESDVPFWCVRAHLH